MASSNLTLYRVLTKLGVSEQDAESASAMDTTTLTKADIADLKVVIGEAKSDLQRWTVLLMIAMTAIYAGLVSMIKIFT